jgi:transposase
MWTSENRGRMAEIQRKTKRYPSDLTDEEWAAMAPLLPGAARTGRKRSVDFREILNAIRYMVRSGCEWRMLPAHFGVAGTAPSARQAVAATAKPLAPAADTLTQRAEV